jgi:hypothetical protein
MQATATECNRLPFENKTPELIGVVIELYKTFKTTCTMKHIQMRKCYLTYKNKNMSKTPYYTIQSS